MIAYREKTKAKKNQEITWVAPDPKESIISVFIYCAENVTQ